MKFTTTVATFGMAALVAAVPQAKSDSTITAAPTSVSVSVDPAWASTLSCISACGPGNVYCQADCQNLPTPDETAVNATHDCVANCPPGGDDEKNAAWAKCQQSCVSSYYWTASTPWGSVTLPVNSATVTNTGVDATATDDDSDPSETDGSESESPSATESPNAASINGASISLLGAFGLFLGALVL